MIYEMSCHFSKSDLFMCFLRANCNRFLFSPTFLCCSLLKFSYSKKATKILSLIIWHYYLVQVMTKKSGRWTKFLWPSQNIWTLLLPRSQWISDILRPGPFESSWCIGFGCCIPSLIFDVPHYLGFTDRWRLQSVEVDPPRHELL